MACPQSSGISSAICDKEVATDRSSASTEIRSAKCHYNGEPHAGRLRNGGNYLGGVALTLNAVGSCGFLEQGMPLEAPYPIDF
jgi:hypothetical protein